MDFKVVGERFPLNVGDRDERISARFREVAKSQARSFNEQKDYVHRLLDGKHNQSSGIFREGLLKDFLERVLPKAVSVDSGFVYGFGQIPSSKQMDVLIWDSMRHAAVYRTNDFVIVPPEAVIVAISVKSKLTGRDINDALDNLMSISPLEIMFRASLDTNFQPIFRPITKIVFSYSSPKSAMNARDQVANFFTAKCAADENLAKEMVEALTEFNPLKPLDRDMYKVERIFPRLIMAVDEQNFCMTQGLGPPEDSAGEYTYGPGLKRLPYLYPQNSYLTTPLEKMVYEILTSVYLTLNTEGWSLVAAWGDLNPVLGARVGDAGELEFSTGIQLIDPNNLAGVSTTTQGRS